jgi:hypothetical protein
MLVRNLLGKRETGTLVEALRQMALEVEHGDYDMTEHEQKILIKLIREILFYSQSKKPEYKAKTPRLQPQRLIDEEEDEQEDTGTQSGISNYSVFKQKMDQRTKSSKNSGREPGE